VPAFRSGLVDGRNRPNPRTLLSRQRGLSFFIRCNEDVFPESYVARVTAEIRQDPSRRRYLIFVTSLAKESPTFRATISHSSRSSTLPATAIHLVIGCTGCAASKVRTIEASHRPCVCDGRFSIVRKNKRRVQSRD